MTTITLEDIQRDLLGYFHRLQSGETLRVMEANQPAVEIKRVEQTNPQTSLRPFGLNAGEFTVPDDFDAPLPEEILRDFEGV